MITVSGVLEVKARFSYKALDRVTQSLCASHWIVYHIVSADNLQGPLVRGKVLMNVKPSSKGFNILLFFHFLTIWPLSFQHTSYGLI